jgi:hypothetical protein
LPEKISNEYYDYYFTGKWYDWDNNKKVYYQDYEYIPIAKDDYESGKEYYIYSDHQYKVYDKDFYPTDDYGYIIYEQTTPDNSFLNFKPTDDMYLVPEFLIEEH